MMGLSQTVRFIVAITIASQVAVVTASNLKQEKVIVLNVTGHSPLNEKDKSGFMDKIAALAFKRLGYQLETIHLPAERALKNSNAGIEDGEMSRIKGIHLMYPNLIMVPEALMNWEFVLFCRDTKPVIHGWKGLADKSIAYINGWKILEKQVPVSAEVTTVKNIDQLFLLLFKNRVDYIIYERWGGLKYLQDNKIHGIKMIQPALAVKSVYIYLHKKHARLVDKLGQVLLALKREGIYQQIYSSIFDELSAKKL